jgi:CMP-N,N'-diacetyllegionaminic acid synthase
MRLLALITARGGSKRLPGKNIRMLGGRPLVTWSIDVAKGIEAICDILVSTDDPATAAVARKAGALVPWLRPAHLASDTATSADVCLHALDWYEAARGKVDGLLLLQPTSPFRSRASVLRAIKLFEDNAYRSVLGVSPAASHPMWCFRLEGQTMRPFLDQSLLGSRSQDLPPAYVVNGALYLIAPEDLRRLHAFYDGDNTIPLVSDNPSESIDIDSEWDWQMAESVLLARAQPIRSLN